MPTLRKSEQLKRLLTRRLREIFERGFVRRVVGGAYTEQKIHGAYHRVVRQWHADLDRGDQPQLADDEPPKLKRDGRTKLKNLAIANIIDVLRCGADEHEIGGEIVQTDLPAALFEAARKWHGELKALEQARDARGGGYDPAAIHAEKRTKELIAAGEWPDGDDKSTQTELNNE